MEDSIGASAILISQKYLTPEQYLDAQVVELEEHAPWHRKFNLLGETTLFVKIPESGKLRVVGSGVNALYRFEPFLTSRSANYQTPAWRESGFEFELDQGLYVLTIEPQTKGILDLNLLPSGSVQSEKMSPINPVARFSSIMLQPDTNYTMYLNHQPGVASGAFMRPLPINLDIALPVTQRIGETLTIPVLVSERGTIQALTEDGSALPFALDNGKSGAGIEVEAGQYNVTIKGADKVQSFALKLEPLRLASNTPLPAVPDAKLAGLPKFPVITPGTPRFVDINRRSTTTSMVRVDTPGLYQFESTGLLHTKGKIRTRTNPLLFEGSENGIGSNFLIQRYLREGDYQLSVSTLGKTQGDLGVQVARSDVIDGGELREGQAAHALLPMPQAIAYQFRITARGTYHLQTLGLGRNFDIRLEDAGGWPVSMPVSQGDITMHFEPGHYRVLVLPQTADARVLVRLDQIPEPIQFNGHGPHLVVLESEIEHSWLEPVKGAARVPDQWEFRLPAQAEITITLDSEMEASLVSATDPKHTVIAKINALSAWRGRLAAGRYLVLAQHNRSNNHVPYTLRISSTQLLAGQSRTVTAPASIPISVGSDGLIELESFGAADVRAKLMDSAGELIAQNDDRPDDWNFQIAQRLRPGEYQLIVDPVDEKESQTTVSMFAPTEVVEKAFVPSATIKDGQVHIYPLSIPAERNLLLVSAKSGDVVGLALEGESANGWVNLGSVMKKSPYLALPLPSGNERFKSYRLRSWSVDRRSMQVQLRAVAVTLPSVPEKQWLQGVTPTRVDETLPKLRATMVGLSRPGTFRIKSDFSHMLWSGDANVAQEHGSSVLSVSGKTLWLISEEQGGPESMTAERLRLPSGEQDSLRLELTAGQTGTVDMLPHQNPSLVLATSRAGQPGIALSGHSMGLVSGEAVTVEISGLNSSVNLWNAENSGAPLDADIRQILFQQAGVKSLGFGVNDGMLKSQLALPIKLSGTRLSIRLALAPMNAAVFLKKGVIQSTHWSGAEPLYELVATDADQMWLLNADAHDANYSIEIAPGSAEPESILRPGDLMERNVSTAGVLRIPIELPKDMPKSSQGQYTIRVRGNAQALWMENSGRIVSGSNIVIRDSGVLSLQHQPGTLIAWLDAPHLPQHGMKWVAAWFKAIQETPVKPPQVVTLHDKQQVLSLHLEHATMLHVRTTVPVVTQFVVDGQVPQTEAHLFGANINLLAPVGSSRLLLRAVGADNLSGVATVLATAINPLGEGAGPEVLLAPGSARLYSFEVKQRQTIGIGVRASSDVVHGVLYDERGILQSEGVVQMPTLAPGRYYLSIDLPPDSAPVRVQPILLGLNKLDTRPPLDILRRYVNSKSDDAMLYVTPPPAPPADTAQQGEDSPPADAENEQ